MISFVGGVLLGIDGIMILLMLKKQKKYLQTQGVFELKECRYAKFI